jgi:hypothetical protein
MIELLRYIALNLYCLEFIKRQPQGAQALICVSVVYFSVYLF